MKHLKQKLMAATAMMMVSIVMLTSASFAWFSISVAPEVKMVTTTVTANQNLEIAFGTTHTISPKENLVGTFDPNTNKDKNNIWGGLVNLTDTEDTTYTATGIGPAIINGDKTSEGVLQYATYGEDGRPNGFDDVILPTEFENGIASFYDGEGGENNVEGGNVIGQSYLIWLRTNVAGGAITATFDDITFLGEDDDKNHVVMAAIQVGKFDADDEQNEDGSYDGTIEWEDTLYPVLAEDEDAPYQTTFFDDDDGMAVNVPVPILIHVYLDGPQVTNEMLNGYVTVEGEEEPATAVIGNIQFTSSAIEKDPANDSFESYVNSYVGATEAAD